MDSDPPRRNDGWGDDDEHRRGQERSNGKGPQSTENPESTDIFGDSTELPVWVFLLLAALLAEHFNSYLCTC